MFRDRNRAFSFFYETCNDCPLLRETSFYDRNSPKLSAAHETAGLYLITGSLKVICPIEIFLNSLSNYIWC